MNIKIKRVSDTAIIPTRAHWDDACFDIYADLGDWVEVIQPGESLVLHTGFATEIPQWYCAMVYPRSGMGIKRHLRLSNGTGVIDAGFRSEWMVSLHNDGKEPQYIHHGDRIAQFMIIPIPYVTLVESEELSDTERGTGGLGSTGA